ncbi:2-oxo-4-hydroxy-4-carboxy-5-ureidoimidazoline decarboxylase [Actinomadura sp. HBU206391]|uniref:2-oxo-4-hydroxy-4-carboxy-5-ureidoimidazoline decarboxylase n=1 Tax=Actinomadura sp. HBU206391 TaxID=2731692 RepID=UPI00164EE9F5|nr:2-oxo-4-hydroxy-4-carboxy-5-ureidoimidazoline decarboxylase [Actinomadura sp. HBU206391]MBC6461855.1 2-oxo-4-hydroxy-4-carboxy-5-ureidoimidazoline decarboxylase [Actinomadura sp. HBU206391]
MTGRPQGLEWLNELSEQDAEQELMSCCGSKAWAAAVAAARPFEDEAALTRAADSAFSDLGWRGVEEALAHHPRIGDRPKGVDRPSAWSRAEQSGVIDSDGEVAGALHEGNLAYERRFGRVFLICATGLPAEELLSALRERLGNDDATERGIVRAELLKITHLRLTKLLERP